MKKCQKKSRKIKICNSLILNTHLVEGVANNALNVRVYSLFVHLELGNTTDLPETIYLKVTHDGDSEFR